MMVSGAEIVDPYRYLLWRRWSGCDDVRWVTWVMLNPSKADAIQDDPTIRRCIGFSKAWGYDGILVVNLFAFRATKPTDLWEADTKLLPSGNIVGPENRVFLEGALREGSRVIAAWGAAPRAVTRGDMLQSWAHEWGVDLQCLGKTKSGAPRHPLYVRADASLTPYP